MSTGILDKCLKAYGIPVWEDIQPNSLADLV